MIEEYDDSDIYDTAAREAIDLGNRLADGDQDPDVWEIADGLLAGAVQYWLYARQPCGNPECEDCELVDTAEKRLAELLRYTDELVKQSEYFHSPNDSNVGTA